MSGVRMGSGLSTPVAAVLAGRSPSNHDAVSPTVAAQCWKTNLAGIFRSPLPLGRMADGLPP